MLISKCSLSILVTLAFVLVFTFFMLVFAFFLLASIIFLMTLIFFLLTLIFFVIFLLRQNYLPPLVIICCREHLKHNIFVSCFKSFLWLKNLIKLSECILIFIKSLNHKGAVFISVANFIVVTTSHDYHTFNEIEAKIICFKLFNKPVEYS